MINNNSIINTKINKSHQQIEQLLNSTNDLHIIEDNLRYRLIKSNNLNNKMILLLARIMYGRYNNSIRNNNGNLDDRHIKAQLITVCSIAVYLNRIQNKNTEHFDLLKRLIVYHVNKINDSLNNLSDNEQNDYYINYLLNNLYLKNFDRLESDIFKILNNNNFKINHNLFYFENNYQFNLSDIENFLI
jgi:hypothetical protein